MILKVKPVKQLENHCGPACVKMILETFKIDKSQKELGIICNFTSTGVAPTAIVRCFRKFKIHSSYKHFPGIRKTIPQYLDEYKNPIIIGTSEHYMLIIGYTDKNFIFLDPADGKRIIMKKELAYTLINDLIVVKGKISKSSKKEKK